jgi:hypothetical protein
MKLFNIFKKESSKEVKSTIQKMDKNQLSKVIGGDGDSHPESTETQIVRSKSNIKNQKIIIMKLFNIFQKRIFERSKKYYPKNG